MVFTMDLTPEGISFGRHSTGFSLAVDNFCRDLSSILKKKVYVSCSSLQNPEIVVASTYTLLRRDMKTILKHCRLQDALRAVSWFFLAKKLSLKQRIQIIKQQISIGLYTHQLKNHDCKIAVVQSTLPHIIPFINACIRTNTPVLIICHADYDDHNLNYESGFARYTIPQLLANGATLSCVSPGIKRYFESKTQHKDHTRINFVRYPKPATLTYIPQASDSQHFFNITVSGNISERKNQIQLIRAISLLPDKSKQNTKLHIVGKDSLNGFLQKTAHDLGVSDNCIFYGSVSREESLRIISNSDLVASTTLSEGFGLPFLEGYSFGIPALFFKDIAAAEILSDPQCCITIEDHKDESVMQAIVKAMETKWDKDYIIEFSEKYSPKSVYQQYTNLIKKLSPITMTERQWNDIIRQYILNKGDNLYR